MNATPEFLKAQISLTAEAARDEGQTVEINPYLPYVAIYRGQDDEYFFQEHEAQELLEKIPEDVDAEDFILWQAQGW